MTLLPHAARVPAYRRWTDGFKASGFGNYLLYLIPVLAVLLHYEQVEGAGQSRQLRPKSQRFNEAQ